MALGRGDGSGSDIYLSLNMKFNAWVGKYLRQFATLPLHKGATPSSAMTRLKQSMGPL